MRLLLLLPKLLQPNSSLVLLLQKISIFQPNVNKAFLRDDLYEEAYMFLPSGYAVRTPTCLSIKKSLYRLKQASRKWFEKL